MRRSHLLACLLAGFPGTAAAQWSARIELGAMTFRGASHDTSGAVPPADFRPYHCVAVRVGVEHRWDVLGVAVSVLRGSPGLALESDETVFVAKNLLAFWEIAPEVSMGVAGSEVSVRLQLGPLFDVWLPEGGTSHSRVGAHAGVSLEWLLGARVSGSVQAALALSSSAFRPGDLPARFELPSLWRRGVAGGVRWRF